MSDAPPRVRRANRVVVFAMTLAAVFAALVRLRRGNIDAGILAQCVLSFSAILAASLPAPSPGESARLARALRTCSLLAFGVALLAAPYVHIALFAPIIALALTVFATWLVVERFGPRGLAVLVVVGGPVGGWLGWTALGAYEHRRVARIVVAEAHVTAEDGRAIDVRGLRATELQERLGALRAIDPVADARDVLRGTLVEAGGRTDPLTLAHPPNSRAITIVTLDGNAYELEEPYDDLVGILSPPPAPAPARPTSTF